MSKNMSENIVTLAASPSEGEEGKRNRKARILSALLSAGALGVFLEGCGGKKIGNNNSNNNSNNGGDSGSNNGGDSGSNNGNNGGGTPSPALVQVTGIAPHLALASAEAFTGDEEANTISYENADEGVTVDLQVPANNRGRFAQKDTYANIENIVGSSHADTLIGNSQDNRLEGGTGADTYRVWRDSTAQIPLSTTAARSSSCKGRTTTIRTQPTLSPVPTGDKAKLSRSRLPRIATTTRSMS